MSSVADSSEYSHWGIFTSSQYDSGKATTKWDRIFWSASATTTDDIIKFQLRSAPDAIGVPGTWTDWLGPTSISDFYLDDQGGETINATHKDGLDDQWLQYRAFLSGVGSSTPILEDVSIEYN